MWPAQGGPTRGELQRAWRWGKAGRRPMQRTRPPVALLLVMEVPIPRCSQQYRMWWMLGRLLRLMHAGRQCMGAHRGSVSRNIRLFLSRRSSVLMWRRRRRNRDARSVTVGGVRLRV